jgi:hypothetical protein
LSIHRTNFIEFCFQFFNFFVQVQLHPVSRPPPLLSPKGTYIPNKYRSDWEFFLSEFYNRTSRAREYFHHIASIAHYLWAIFFDLGEFRPNSSQKFADLGEIPPKIFRAKFNCADSPISNKIRPKKITV